MSEKVLIFFFLCLFVLIDTKGHVKLTDFGLAKLIERDNNNDFGRTNTFCGTVEYMAPEIIIGKGHSKEVDWWTLGTLMYDMLEGRPPFQANDSRNQREDTLRAIRQAKLVLNRDLSYEARSLIISLLQRDEKKRLGYGKNDVNDIISHSFFAFYGLDDKDRIESLDLPYIPFIPEIINTADAPYVENQFKGMTLAGSPPDTIPDPHRETFLGFSYPKNSTSLIQQEESCELGSSPLVTLTCR